MSESPFQMTREEMNDLVMNFREVKHEINNHIAVIMALSELAQLNPTHTEKLIKTTLTRSPEIGKLLQKFQTSLGAKLKEHDAKTAPPA